jgi:hypothetical protein
MSNLVENAVIARKKVIEVCNKHNSKSLVSGKVTEYNESVENLSNAIDALSDSDYSNFLITIKN